MLVYTFKYKVLTLTRANALKVTAIVAMCDLKKDMFYRHGNTGGR